MLMTKSTEDCLPARTLVQAFNKARSTRLSHGGPLSHAIAAIRYAGWDIINANTLSIQSRGRKEELSLCHASPAYVKKLYRDALAQKELDHSLKLHCERHGLEFPGQRDPHLLRRVLHGKKAGLTKKEGHMLKVWCMGKFVVASDFGGPGECALCGEKDSLLHRLRGCQGAEEGPPCIELDKHLAQYASEDPHVTKGFLQTVATAPMNDELWQCFHGSNRVDAEEFEGFSEDAEVYIDGSARDMQYPQLAVAGYGMVEIDDDFEVVKMVCAAVPMQAPPTAACAEHMAMLRVGGQCKGNATAVADCESAITAWARPHHAVHHGQVLAGLWLHEGHDLHKIQKVVKTKAHRKLEEVEGDDIRHYHGNRHADLAAKAAMEKTAPSPLQEELTREAILLQETILAQAARRLARHPYVSEHQSFLSRQAGDSVHNVPLKLAFLHEFVSCGDGDVGFVCKSCLMFVRSSKRKARLMKLQCRPHSSKEFALQRQAQQLGHRLVRCELENGRDLICCARCGRYTSRQYRQLLDHCCGKAAINWRHQYVFARMVHPYSKMRIVRMHEIKHPFVFDHEQFDVVCVNAFVQGMACTSIYRDNDLDNSQASFVSDSD